jgi:CRISPR-associated protein (Cas_Cas02710)
MLKLKQQNNRFDITNLFSPRSPISYLGFALINTINGLFSIGNPIGLLLVPAIAVTWWLWERHYQKNIEWDFSFSLTKQAPQPSKGLILVLSPYDPRIPNAERETLENAIQTLLRASNVSEEDFTSIHLTNSNLAPQLAAVQYHAEANKLRDIWLVTTNNSGSQLAADIFICYVNFKYGKKQFDIHRNDALIEDYDYAGLWQLGEKIFQDARQEEKYQDDAVVADITGGTKMVSLAIAMACIPPGRRMQYMDAQRDWQGNPIPKGEMQPVDIDVDPIMLHHNARR